MSGARDKEDLKTLNNTLESLILQLREGGDGGRHGFLVRQTKIIALKIIRASASDSKESRDKLASLLVDQNNGWLFSASVKDKLTDAGKAHLSRLEDQQKGLKKPAEDPALQNENKRLKATTDRLIEELAAYAAETEKQKLGLDNYNRRLERENEELRKRLAQKNLKPEIKRRESLLEQKHKTLSKWQEDHKEWVLSSKEVKVGPFTDVRIEELKNKHEAEIKKLKDQIKALQENALKIESTVAEQIFIDAHSGELDKLRTNYDVEIEKLEKNIITREHRIARYKVKARLRLKAIQDAELSLRWQIKEYELLVATECKRLGIPPPKISQQKTKFALFEVQRGRGHHEIEVRNLSIEPQSLSGYRLISEKGEWKFPHEVKLESGADLGIVVSVSGSRAIRGYETGKLSATLNFVAPLDTLALINPQGKVECEETVFSDDVEDDRFF